MRECMSTSEFVDKYKLIPKNLRKNFLDYMYDIIKKTNIVDELYVNDILDTLNIYEEDNKKSDNYTELNWLLLETIENDNSYIYSDLSKSLKDYMSTKSIINREDIFRFRKKVMLKSIREEVSYRPGNVGYENTRDHFYLISMKL